MRIFCGFAGDALASGLDAIIDSGTAALGFGGFGGTSVGGLARAGEIGSGLVRNAGEACHKPL